MDNHGNILVRRTAKSNVYVKSTASNANDETAIGADILKLPNNALESEKIMMVIFDLMQTLYVNLPLFVNNPNLNASLSVPHLSGNFIQ